MSHTTRLAFLGKGASFLAIFLVQLLVVYLVVTVTGNRRPSRNTTGMAQLQMLAASAAQVQGWLRDGTRGEG